MSFIWPFMLISLVLIPIGVWLYLRQQRRRRAFTWGGLAPAGAAGKGIGRRRHLPWVLFLIALTTLLIALARPQTVLSLPRTEGTVILAFDVSGSMAAEDLQPTRIEAAKAAARDFVARQPRTVQIGVVSFSDNGFTVQPPTSDQAAILGAIDRLAPARGTSLANGILTALHTIELAKAPDTTRYYTNLTPTATPEPTPVPTGYYEPAAIVLLSDGDNNESPDPAEAAQAAAERGVRIYTVGIGSPGGIDLKINGFLVHTQLDEGALQNLADATDGKYYNAESTEELIAVYDNLNPQLVVKTEKTEITSLLAGASLLIFMAGGALSLVWFGRVP